MDFHPKDLPITKVYDLKNETRDVKYWTYHYDDEHFAIVLIDNSALTELGF